MRKRTNVPKTKAAKPHVPLEGYKAPKPFSPTQPAYNYKFTEGKKK